MVKILKNWSVTVKADAYTAPESVSKRLVGICNNKCIMTSSISKVNGRYVETYSGSIYYLDSPDKNYLDWMLHNGYEYNPEHPIKCSH